MSEFVFKRSFPWLQGAFDPLTPSVFPGAISGTVAPVADIFGTQRVDEQQFEAVQGDAGVIELTHSEVPPGRARYYSTIDAIHNSAVNRWIRIGQVLDVNATPPFPFVAFQNAASRPGDPALNGVVGGLALRAMWVGPRNRAAVKIEALGPFERIFARFVWTELPLGEAIRFT